MLVCIAPLSACCHLDQPNYLCNCRLVLHAVPCGRQRTLAHAPCHSSCTCCTQRRFMMGCIPPWAILARYTTLSNLCFMHFCCSLPGGSAPRGPTYSTVLEHHTGISARCDDQHVFFVHMGDSLQEKSCRISPEHLKLNRYPTCSGSPPLIPVTTTERNKITRLEPYWYVEVLFGPAYQELSIEISTCQ